MRQRRRLVNEVGQEPVEVAAAARHGRMRTRSRWQLNGNRRGRVQARSSGCRVGVEVQRARMENATGGRIGRKWRSGPNQHSGHHVLVTENGQARWSGGWAGPKKKRGKAEDQ